MTGKTAAIACALIAGAALALAAFDQLRLAAALLAIATLLLLHTVFVLRRSRP